jgi:hypothetical protein
MKHTTVNEKETSGSYVFIYFRITLLHSIHDAVIEMFHYKAFFNTMDWWGICPTGPFLCPTTEEKNGLLPQSHGPRICIA